MGKYDNLAALARGSDEAGDAVRQTIRAYHGSPYDFDRFDASKIDTGEGAQAYGHGLYFAGKEDVARQYRDSLSGHQIMIDGQPMPTGLSDWTRDWAGRLASGRDVSKEVVNLRRSLQAAATERGLLQRTADELGPEAAYEKVGLMSSLASEKVRAQNLEDRLMAYEALAGKDIRYNPGRMYEVEIAHPEHVLLDWDAPISRQPKVIQKAFGEYAMDQPGDGGRIYRDIATRRGEEFDDDMTGLLAGRAAAEELLQEGIPGIRYLDGGSRRAGDGTRNYVVFPGAEDSIRILRKYAIPGAVGTGVASQYGEER
jgi:hypothetical protein